MIIYYTILQNTVMLVYQTSTPNKWCFKAGLKVSKPYRWKKYKILFKISCVGSWLQHQGTSIFFRMCSWLHHNIFQFWQCISQVYCYLKLSCNIYVVLPWTYDVFIVMLHTHPHIHKKNDCVQYRIMLFVLYFFHISQQCIQ